MNFGALNSDGGEKRLNVAVTRARCELHVIASITHDQIDLSRTRAKGVRDLKTFLDYAERGAVALPARDQGSLGPAENFFEEAVAEAFRVKGWEVRTQIGVSGFRIDLGIVHPDKSGAFLSGIECDGASYHSSATARDRDKIRQSVLEGLGWNILRVWSTDWFRNPSAIVDRLNSKLLDLLDTQRQSIDDENKHIDKQGCPIDNAGSSFSAEGDKVDAEVNTEVDEIPANSNSLEEQLDIDLSAIAENDIIEQPIRYAKASEANSFLTKPPTLSSEHRGGVRKYSNSELRLDANCFFDDSYLSTLRVIVDDLVDTFAPITLLRLGRKIALLHGWQRTGNRIQTRVEEAIQEQDIHDEFGKAFVWPSNGYRSRCEFLGLEERSLLEVSRTEIATVLDRVGCNLSDIDDPVRDLARHLGINRLSKSNREYLVRIMKWYAEDDSAS